MIVFFHNSFVHGGCELYERLEVSPRQSWKTERADDRVYCEGQVQEVYESKPDSSDATEGLQTESQHVAHHHDGPMVLAMTATMEI